MPEDKLLLPQESDIQRMVAAICPDISRSLVNIQTNPALPFGNMYPDMQDWILDDIIAWISSLWQFVSQSFQDVWNKINQALNDAVSWIVDRISPVVNAVWGLIKPYIDWLTTKLGEVWDKLWTIGTEIYQQVSSALAGMGNYITGTIIPFFQQIPAQIGGLLQQGWSIVTTAISNGIGWLGDRLGEIGRNIGNFFAEQWQHIVDFWNGAWANFTQWLGQLNLSLDPILKGIGDIPGTVLKGITDLNKSLFDSATAWLKQDAHDSVVAINKSMPYPYEEVHSGFLEDFWKGLGGIFQFGSDNFMKNFNKVTPEAFTNTEEWYETLFNIVQWGISLPFQGLEALLKSFGTVSPGPNNTALGIMTSAATVTVAGLGGMMIAGELVGFFKHFGLGYVSAMIYDISNFKELTRSYVTSISHIYIEQPMTYFYNSLGRPYVPGVSQLLQMVSERILDKAQFMDIAKYHGYSDDYLDKIYSTAMQPARYFALRGMAESGSYDESYFTHELEHAGYNDDTVKQLLTMLKRYSVGDVKGVMIGASTKRFRYGLSSESDMRTELATLGAPKSLIDHYVFAANLDYQTDYANDLMTAYRTQYNKGMIDEATLRGYLDAIGIQSDRVEAYVLLENAKLFKAPKTTKAPVPVPQYLTDDGKIKANTAIQAFRLNLSSAAELQSELIKLQMDTSLAEAYVEYEIVKKTPKEA